jgi:hypothetical protein
MSRLGRQFLYDRDLFVAVAYLAVILAIPQRAFAWGGEGHQIVVIMAQRYMRPDTDAHMRELLDPENPEEASAWADEYRRDHRETGPWHCIDIPLADSKIDLAGRAKAASTSSSASIAEGRLCVMSETGRRGVRPKGRLFVPCKCTR